MPIPRINTRLMSAAARENLERIQASLCVVRNDSPLAQEAEKSSAKSRKKKTLTPDMADKLVKSVKVSEDGNEVKIILELQPGMLSTAQQKGAFVGKDGRVHFFTKAKIAKAEKTLRKALEPYAVHTRRWGEVPIEVVFDYFFPYPSGTPKKHQHRIGPMNERPDASNITKGVCDAMTAAGFWPDDSFINTEVSRKRRTTGPTCTRITIINLQPKFDALYRETEEYDKPTLFSKSEVATKPTETNPLSDLISDESSPLK